MHGNKLQRDRDSAIRSFKNNENSILIATDVASRGLDINDIKQVIIYDFPNNAESYVHRIGRTGRNGNMGLAHIFVTDQPNSVYKPVLDIISMSGHEVPEWFCELANGRSYFDNEMYENFSVVNNKENASESNILRKNRTEDQLQKRDSEIFNEKAQKIWEIEAEKCEFFERRKINVLADVGNELYSLSKLSKSIDQKPKSCLQKENSTERNKNSGFYSEIIQKIPKTKIL